MLTLIFCHYRISKQVKDYIKSKSTFPRLNVMSKVLDCVHLSNPRQIKEVILLWHFHLRVLYSVRTGLETQDDWCKLQLPSVFMQGPLLNVAWWVHQLWRFNFSRFLENLPFGKSHLRIFSPDWANREQNILAVQVFLINIFTHTFFTLGNANPWMHLEL